MTQDTEAERRIRRFAVYSPTGVHIGLWGDGKIAADVAAEIPGSTIEELISADEYEALRSERDALRGAVREERHAIDTGWTVHEGDLMCYDSDFILHRLSRLDAALTGEAKP